MNNELLNSNISVAPSYNDFGGIYSDDEMDRDRRKVMEIRKKLNISAGDRDKRSTFSGVENAENAALLERDILRVINDDLFQEWGEDDGGLIISDQAIPIKAQHTHEFDDYVNHSDLVCVIQNSLSGDQPIPFLLDVTYNSDGSKLCEKFGWSHPKHRDLPGIGKLKYYHDIDSFDEDERVLPTGQIEVAPRFIVGFNPELCADHTPAGEAKKSLCLLTELKEQSAWMLKNYQRRYPDRAAAPELVRETINYTTVLDRYFQRAYNMFDQKLKAESIDLSEIPMSKYYDDPQGYYRQIHQYLSSNAEPVVPAISTQAGLTFGN